GADVRPRALSDRYDRGVDTASRSSKYPWPNSGATTSSANASAYPIPDHCRTQWRTAVTLAGLELTAPLLLSRSGCIVVRLEPFGWTHLGRTRGRGASRDRGTHAGWPRIPLQVVARRGQYFGLGLGAGHLFARPLVVAEEAVVGGV